MLEGLGSGVYWQIMNSNVILILFLLLAPAFAALGHDVYRIYEYDQDKVLAGVLEIPWNKFEFSDLGWLWVHYHPESYDWAQASMNPAFWDHAILPLLEQPAVLAGLIPALLFVVWLLIVKIFRALHVPGARKSRFAAPDFRPSKGAMKYKRR